jgi:Lrp/AsnC family transcriptional regulator, leucine-responsive regulatory protein
MDHLDHEILGILAAEGRISYTELGERVHLSHNGAADRARRLVRTGVIRAFRAEVDYASLGRPLQALIDIRLRPDIDPSDAEASIARLPQLVEAIHVTGRVDYTLHVACRDTTDLDELLTALNRNVGAGETDTRLILRRLQPAPSS